MTDEEKLESQSDTPPASNKDVPPSTGGPPPASGGSDAPSVATIEKPEVKPKNDNGPAEPSVLSSSNEAAANTGGDVSGENPEEDMMAMLEDLPSEDSRAKVDDIHFDSAYRSTSLRYRSTHPKYRYLISWVFAVQP